MTTADEYKDLFRQIADDDAMIAEIDRESDDLLKTLETFREEDRRAIDARLARHEKAMSKYLADIDRRLKAIDEKVSKKGFFR